MTGPEGRRGYVLIAVLWALAVIGGIVAGTVAAGLAERRAIARSEARSRAHWAARGAMALAFGELDHALARVPETWGDRSGWARGDTVLPPVETELGGVRVRAVLIDARARVNLRLADVDALRALFAAVGAPDAAADAAASAIVRRRSGDESGEEPPGRPWVTEADAASWTGVPPELLQLITPYTTLVGDGKINVATAPLPVLLTLRDIDRSLAEEMVRLRAMDHAGLRRLVATSGASRKTGVTSDPETGKQITMAPRYLVLRAEADSPGPAGSVEMEATIVLAGGRAWRLSQVIER